MVICVLVVLIRLTYVYHQEKNHLIILFLTKIKKYLSNYIIEKKANNKFKGVIYKEQEVFYIDRIYEKYIIFTGFTKKDLYKEILIVEINILSLSQDLNLNNKITRYVIFTQGIENEMNNKDNNDKEDISISICMRQYMF